MPPILADCRTLRPAVLMPGMTLEHSTPPLPDCGYSGDHLRGVDTMRSIGVREFRDQATTLLASQEMLVVERHGQPIGFYIPIVPKDLAARRAALDAFGEVIEKVLAQTGIDEDELVREIVPEYRFL